jgi:diguanylate cyclase (GGDEF)-like protein/PAS domain S-box-containing protein
MLAYEPGMATGYDFGLTVLSLVVAVLVTGAGLAIAVQQPFRHSAVLGGAVVGAGIAVMHFTGMAALEVPGRLKWSGDLVGLSIVFGIMFAGAALFVAQRREDWRAFLIATGLLTLAIVSMHFTAMGAIEIIPDPTRVPNPLAISPQSLALIIGGTATAILGMCLVGAMSARTSEHRLRDQKVLLDAALQNMSQGLCMFDASGRIVLFNERYRELMGVPAEFLQGRSLLDLFKHRKATGDFTGDPDEFFNRIMSQARDCKWDSKIMESARGRVLRVCDSPMEGGGWVATYEDITEWRNAQAQIAHMARHDPLTDLPNRTMLAEAMEQALRAAGNHQVAVLCLDLDHFKEVNDSLGHPIGDDLLKVVGQRIDECIRETDTLARLGGDEFAILQVGTHDQPPDPAALASRLVDILSVPYESGGHQVVIGVSIGVSVAPTDSTDPNQLLKNADMALYRAKADGRGTYRFFEPEMDARAQDRRALELDMRAALVRGEFELYYQPILEVDGGHIVAFEALARWNHPMRGTIQPDDFIPLAEQTGLIVPLGEWVLRTACLEAGRWSQEVGVAVNLSAVQFKGRSLVATVVSALSASGLRPKRLELEITESVLLEDCAGTLATLHSLRKLGVRIAMDDFGTGYSSLSYLRSFPFDKIKIDRSFVHELGALGDSMAIVKAVAGLGRSLGICTTAEGVETREQLTLLRNEGCTEVQGYLFSPPRAASDVERLLAEQSGRREVA